MTTNERLQAYTGEGLEVGMLTLAEARERYDSAEVEVTDAGHRTITVGEPIEVEWSETPVAGATVHLSDGVLGYWATVPATWAEAQVRAAFLETADYDEVPRITVTLREGNEHAACFAKCGPTRTEVIAHAAEVSAEGAVTNADAETVQDWRTWEPQDADLDGLQADLRRAGFAIDLSRDERAEFATAFAEAVEVQVAQRFPQAR